MHSVFDSQKEPCACAFHIIQCDVKVLCSSCICQQAEEIKDR